MSLLNRQLKPRKPGAAAWVLAAKICILLFARFRCRRAQVKKRIDPSNPAASRKCPPAARKRARAICSSLMAMWTFAMAVRVCAPITWNTTRKRPKRWLAATCSLISRINTWNADEAHYNVKTGHGTFHQVRGTVKIERRPNPSVLLSDNPLYFEAHDVERLPQDMYVIQQAWITICDPEHPTWQFFAPHARSATG